MGKNNRQRRAAKARARRARARQHAPPGGTRPRSDAPGDRDGVETVPPAHRFVAAVAAFGSGDTASVERLVASLATDAPGEVASAIADVIEQRVARLWDDGWQPADVDRIVARRCGATEAALVRCVVAAQSGVYAGLGARVVPRWMAQLDDIEATRWWDPRRPYLVQLDGSWEGILLASVHLLVELERLPRLPRLVDPPSAWSRAQPVAHGSLPSNVLAKVRALLAKAEATTFEAEAFTAKAQELMARHRIDRAVLADGGGEQERPIGRRVGVDDPYADAKAALLHGIAEANGCSSVWSKELGFATVFGFDGELDGVDELYTSLLVQATAALRREGSKRDLDGRSRTRRFRRSFLVAFAVRIAHRLRATVEATVTAAGEDCSTALVPLLAAREEAARAAAAAAFPDVGSFAPSATDAEGWRAGTVCADLADVSLAAPLEGEDPAA